MYNIKNIIIFIIIETKRVLKTIANLVHVASTSYRQTKKKQVHHLTLLILSIIFTAYFYC